MKCVSIILFMCMVHALYQEFKIDNYGRSFEVAFRNNKDNVFLFSKSNCDISCNVTLTNLITETIDFFIYENVSSCVIGWKLFTELEILRAQVQSPLQIDTIIASSYLPSVSDDNDLLLLGLLLF